MAPETTSTAKCPKLIARSILVANPIAPMTVPVVSSTHLGPFAIGRLPPAAGGNRRPLREGILQAGPMPPGPMTGSNLSGLCRIFAAARVYGRLLRDPCTPFFEEGPA